MPRYRKYQNPDGGDDIIVPVEDDDAIRKVIDQLTTTEDNLSIYVDEEEHIEPEEFAQVMQREREHEAVRHEGHGVREIDWKKREAAREKDRERRLNFGHNPFLQQVMSRSAETLQQSYLRVARARAEQEEARVVIDLVEQLQSRHEAFVMDLYQQEVDRNRR